jgi:DNA-binding response OmpR family regulator
MKIFTVKVSEGTVKLLRENEFLVSATAVETPEELFSRIDGRAYDAVIVNLQKTSWSASAIRYLRDMGTTTAVIVIAPFTGSSLWSKNRADFLENGADDYIFSPIDSRELIASILVAIRRDRTLATGIRRLTIDGISIMFNLVGKQVLVNDDLVRFTISELRIFESLALNLGFIKSRDNLIDTLYEDCVDLDDRSIDSHVKRMRSKMNVVCAGAGAIIKTVYSVGYTILEKDNVSR